MDVQCITWKAHPDQLTAPPLRVKCGDALANVTDGVKLQYCDRAIDSGVTRAEDLIRYGE